MAQYPCDSQGVCMVCKVLPPKEEKLNCISCTSQWHVPCLSSSSSSSSPPPTLAATSAWKCPDCSNLISAPTQPCNDGGSDKELVSSVLVVEADASLTPNQKSKKRQAILAGKSVAIEEKGDDNMSVSEKLTRILNCSICLELPERPVTTPCGHSFCLKCFEKWICQGKRTCSDCRQGIPTKMVSQPRINSALVFAIRMARVSSNNGGKRYAATHFLHNQNRPDEAFISPAAQKKGLANASSGKIFVTVPTDHFGPIGPENDPKRNQGLLVGESWPNRLACRQWGAHFIAIGGIAGQSARGAQSVVLSGGYVDDLDYGEWFLYTGSGGKNLGGNKRTNKNHSSDQKFKGYNQSLQMSCLKGYPVRVVRSHKEKRSSYAPESGVRYDGIYRIEKCWQITGLQGFKICRYLFVRCDNEPAPWTSDDHGDMPRPLPVISELEKATNIHERTEEPAWDFDEKESSWKWMKPPPPSGQKDPTQLAKSTKEAKKFQSKSIKEQLRRGFSCLICKDVMVSPVTTPCAHNFCKSCLEGVFVGKSFVKERIMGGRTLRSKKVVMKCPACTVDIADYLQNLQVDIDLKAAIEILKDKVEENEELLKSSEDTNTCKGENSAPMKENLVEELNSSTEANKALDQEVKCNAKRKKIVGDKGDGAKAKRGRKSKKVEKAVDEGK